MELRIVNENPKYPPFKLIEPTTLGYIHLAAVVQPRRVPFMPMGPMGMNGMRDERDLR